MSLPKKPYLEWDNRGKAIERLISFRDCSRKNEKMTFVDGYGRGSWKCDECGSWGGHSTVTVVRRVRRPEFDAPTPPEWEDES